MKRKAIGIITIFIIITMIFVFVSCDGEDNSPVISPTVTQTVSQNETPSPLQTSTQEPTESPTQVTPEAPTSQPQTPVTTEITTQEATAKPTVTPTATHTAKPTAKPTVKPTAKPTPTPTPPANAQELVKNIKPVFSQTAGFYTGDISVEISLSEQDKAALKGAGITNYTIRVSYNQEEPTSGSVPFSQSIKLPHVKSLTDASAKFTTSILRAAVFDGTGKLIGKIETATYIKSLRSEKIDLPVISLVTAESNLTGSKGIITNYNQRGSAWERPVHLEFIEKDGILGLSQDAGVRMFGGSSRSQAQKSFRLSARKSSYFNATQYDGDGKFNYAFFPDRLAADGSLLEDYDSIVLRNGGNDAMVNGTQNIRTSFMRDGFVALIAQKAAPNVDGMAYRPVIVILNGAYYGMLNMREHESENYVANVYKIADKENITLISSELDTSTGGRYDGSWFYYKQDEGPAGELAKFQQIMQDIGKGKYTYEEVGKYVDLDNFLEYCAINIFVCNTDWPHNNVRLYKYADGKYRFMMRDADLGMARYTVSTAPNMPSELYTKADAYNFRYLMWSELTNTQRSKLSYSGYPNVDYGYYSDPLYLKGVLDFCLKNDSFRAKFVDYCEKLATEIWSADNLKAMAQAQKSNISTEMKYHIKRWLNNIGKYRDDLSPYAPEEDRIQQVYDYWFKNTVDESIGQWITQRCGADGYFLRDIYAVCGTYGNY